MQYIIEIRCVYGYDYYLGKCYTHQGEKFPCVGIKEEAKKYSSRGFAERVVKSLIAIGLGLKDITIIEEEK